MIPQLYDSEGKYLECWLHDTIKCNVTEEKNSTYELELEYLGAGKYSKFLTVDKLIRVKANQLTDNWQFFKIYSFENRLTGNVIVKAEHISYGLSGYPLPLTSGYNYSSVADVVSWIKTNTYHKLGDYNISGSVLSETNTLTLTEVSNASEMFLGADGICSKHNLCAYRDNLSIKMLTPQTQGQSYSRITYGINLKDYKCSVDKTSVYNCIFPYYIWNDNGNRKLITMVNNSPTSSAQHIADNNNYYYLSNYKAGDRLKCYSLDMANVIGSDYIADTIASSGSINFRPAVEAYVKANISALTDPAVVTTVDFVNLADTINYKNIAPLLQLGMHSSVTLRIPHLSLEANILVTGYKYDVLTERYSSMTLGNVETKLSALYTKSAKAQQRNSGNINTLPSLIYSITKR